MPGVARSLYDRISGGRVVVGLTALADVVALLLLGGSGSVTLVLPAVVSLAVTRSNLVVASWAAAWLFVGAFLYETTPRLFPPRAEAVTGTRQFRLVVAVLGAAAGVLLEAVLSTGDPQQGLGSPLGGTGGTGVVLLALLVGGPWVVLATVRWAGVEAHVGEFTVDVLDAWTPFSDLESADVLNLAQVAALLGAVLALTAVFGLVALALSPLPEYLALVWVLGAPLNRLLGEPVRLPSADAVDLEGRLADLVAAVTAGPKGAVSGLVVLLGVLPFVVVAGEMAGDPSTWAAAATGEEAAITLYFLSGFSVAAVYGLWYWTRMLDRLPAFLVAWTDLSPRERRTHRQWRGEQQSATRPPGLMVPPTLALLVVTVGSEFAWSSPGSTVSPTYLLYFVVVLAVVAATVARAVRRPPQGPLSDAVAIPAAVTVEWTLVEVAFRGTVDAVTPLRERLLLAVEAGVVPVDALVTVGEQALLVGLPVAFVFYLPDAVEQRHRGGAFTLLPATYVGAFGLAGAALAPPTIDPLALTIAYLAAGAAVGELAAKLPWTDRLGTGTFPREVAWVVAVGVAVLGSSTVGWWLSTRAGRPVLEPYFLGVGIVGYVLLECVRMLFREKLFRGLVWLAYRATAGVRRLVGFASHAVAHGLFRWVGSRRADRGGGAGVAAFRRAGDHARANHLLEDAAGCYERALECARDGAVDDAVRARLAHRLAAARATLGEFDAALSAVEDGLGWAAAPRQAARLLDVRARVRRRRGDREAAVAVAQRQHDQAESADDPGLAAAARVHLGWVALERGDLAGARDQFDRALERATGVDDDRRAVRANVGLAVAATADDDLDAAADHLADAWSWVNEPFDDHLVAAVDLAEGRLALREGTCARAREHLEAALEGYRLVEDRHGAATARLHLGDALMRDYEYEAAREHLAAAHGAFTAMGDAAGVEDTEELQSKLPPPPEARESVDA